MHGAIVSFRVRCIICDMDAPSAQQASEALDLTWKRLHSTSAMPSPRPPTPSQSERLQLEVRILASELEAASATPTEVEQASEVQAEEDVAPPRPSIAPRTPGDERAAD